MKWLGAVLLLLGFSTSASAACSVPYTFANFVEIAFANQVNANFQAVVNCANGIVSPFATSQLALASLPVSIGTVIVASPTVPSAVYQGVPGVCTFNDGGSQIPALAGGCWKLTAQTTYDIRWWGLTANPVNFYVTAGGNDYGPPGLGANKCVVAAIPCATPTQAAAMANQFCVQGGDAWLNLGPGTWAYTIQQNGPLPCSGNSGVGLEQGELVINGSGASTILTGEAGQNRATDAKTFGVLAVQNLTIASSVVDLWTEIGGDTDVFAGVTLGAASAQLSHTEDPGSQTNFWDSFTVSGGADAAWLADTNSGVVFNPVGGSPTVTFTGAPTFSAEIFSSAYEATIFVGSTWTFAGAVTGPSFQVVVNGGIYHFGVPLPGSAGMLSSGGVVSPGVPPISYVDDSGGLGVGGSVAALVASNNDYAGAVGFTTGSSGTSASGSVTITFGSNVVGRLCTVTPLGDWAISVSNMKVASLPSSNSCEITWSNGGSALPTNNVNGYSFIYTSQSTY